MARTPDPKLHALWRDRIGRQEASGLTIARFCAQERLSIASFAAWKRRFRLIDLADRRLASPASPVFLPVAVRGPEHTLAEPLPIEAELPNGIHLRIPTTNQRLACRIIRTIAAARTSSGAAR